MADISTFTVTFLVEIQNVELWDDCSEGFLDLEPPIHGMRLTYALYPKHSCDLDVLIWPQVAKVSVAGTGKGNSYTYSRHWKRESLYMQLLKSDQIWCHGSAGWSRTWLHLGRRWLAFSVRHMASLNIYEMRDHAVVATLKEGLAVLSQEARNDKTTQVYIPKLDHGERRQFASVIEDYEYYSGLERFILHLLWDPVEQHIPISYLDGNVDVPFEVSDFRHQDKVLRAVDLEISQRPQSISIFSRSVKNFNSAGKINKKGKLSQDQVKGSNKTSQVETRITGDAVLSGVGYVVTSESPYNDTEQVPFVMLLSSQNLPPQTQRPVFFVHIYKLHDLPLEAMKNAGFTQVYTRWKVMDEEHSSRLFPLSTSVLMKDPRALPLERSRATELVTSFQDKFLEIEIRAFGYILPSTTAIIIEKQPGYVAKLPQPQPKDVVIAMCPVDLKTLIVGNKAIRGSFPVIPPKNQEGEISTSSILEATPTLTLSIGFIGCRPAPIADSFSRLLCCAPTDSKAAYAILEELLRVNEEVNIEEHPEDLLTGWLVDLVASSVIFLEGPRDGGILFVWSKALEYEHCHTSFSSNMRYSTRLYSEFIESAPFLALKIHKPIAKLLTSPQILLNSQSMRPFPARDALMKVGRLSICGVDQMASVDNLPTALELLELKEHLADMLASKKTKKEPSIE